MSSSRLTFGSLTFLQNQNLCACRRTWLSRNGMATSTSSAVKKHIKVPNYIPRGPTDILKALSATIGVDPTAAHYKYHDDPHLIPSNSLNKRQYALSKESGRKAARFIRDTHPEFFQHRDAEPFIPAFAPAVNIEAAEVSEETLQQMINNGFVTDSCAMYKKIIESGAEVSYECRTELLELVCFYNCGEAADEEWAEEKWFQFDTDRPRKNTWKSGGFAEELYGTFSEKTSRVQCALLQGMCRHFQVQNSWELYETMLRDGVEMDVHTYNCVLSCCTHLQDAWIQKWECMQSVLLAMSGKGVSPNQQTLAVLLTSLASMRWDGAKEKCLQLVAEFNSVGIKPSLGGYYALIQIFTKNTNPREGRSNILYDVMAEVEGCSYTIQDKSDTLFFAGCMKTCLEYYNDPELAYRIDALLHVGDNYNLMGDSRAEGFYYNDLFAIIIGGEPVEKVFALYNKLVPHLYVPTVNITKDIINLIDISGATEYIPQIWSDILHFNYVLKQGTVGPMFRCLVDNILYTPEGADPDTLEKFRQILLSFLGEVKRFNENKKREDFLWDRDILSNVIIVSCKTGEFSSACTLLLQSIEGDLVEVSAEAITQFHDEAILRNNINFVMVSVNYMADMGMPELSVTIKKTLDKIPTLSETQVEALNKLLEQSKHRQTPQMDQDTENRIKEPY